MVLLVSSVPAGLALADGDPASDVLVSQPLFLPQDSGSAAAQQARLAALLTRAASSGYPVRVALVGSRSDLGSVTELWQRPQSYARFLAQELALTYKGPLLVVMPNGYGLHATGGAAARDVAALRRLPPPARQLAPAALNAVLRLAATSGRPLRVPSPPEAGGARSLGPVSWLALAIGAALIAGAWLASLRARPLRRAVGSRP